MPSKKQFNELPKLVFYPCEEDPKDAGLKCPYCGESNGLHHHFIETYCCHDDANKGQRLSIDVNKGLQRLDDDMTGNPSVRRQGISIHFWCEFGCPDAVLNLIQHKGVTYLQWKEKIPFTRTNNKDNELV